LKDYLYHASSRRDLKVIKPSNITVRDPKEGKVVFATNNISYASCFIVPVDDMWAQIHHFTRSEDSRKIETVVFICSDKQRFLNLDKGGAIYKVPCELFENDPQEHSLEWAYKSSVEIIGKKVYRSGLEAMISNDVQLYFVSRDIFDEVKQNKNNFDKILKLLCKLESENERRGEPKLLRKCV